MPRKLIESLKCSIPKTKFIYEIISLQNEKTRSHIEYLDQQQSYAKLRKLLLSRLSFGTAGLRGVMQAGYNAMNDLVVIQTAQGLAKYIKKCFPSQSELANGVVFGYDGRHNSKR